MRTRDYLLKLPRDVTVAAACEDVNCDSWRYGWETTVDESTALGAFQAAYIRQTSGRTYREMRGPDGVTVFRFERGQRCFAEHRTRPARFIIGGVREVPTLGDWIGDLDDHVNRLSDQLRKG